MEEDSRTAALRRQIEARIVAAEHELHDATADLEKAAAALNGVPSPQMWRDAEGLPECAAHKPLSGMTLSQLHVLLGDLMITVPLVQLARDVVLVLALSMVGDGSPMQ